MFLAWLCAKGKADYIRHMSAPRGWIQRLPNQLSALRLALVPVIALLTLEQSWWWAASLFGLAALTDALDGAIARLCDAQSALGQKLDPLADKALVNVTAICLAANDLLPLWLVALVLLRDCLILSGALVSRLRRYPHDLLPLMLGKISTTLQLLLLACVLMLQLGWHWPLRIQPWLIAGVALFALVSGAAYVRDWLREVPRKNNLSGETL
jgi:cardiolipin synthase (CMP-forming)